MEIKLVKSGRAGKSKKTKSFDDHSVNKNGGSRNEDKNRKRKGIADNDGDLENKRKKEKSSKQSFLSTSEVDRKRSKSSLDEKDRDDGVGLEKTPHPEGKLGILLSLEGSSNGFRVPKRPRGFVGRKKSENSNFSSPPSGDKANLTDKIAKSNGSVKSKIVAPKAKVKLGVDGEKKSSSRKSSAQVSVAKEEVHFTVHNNGASSSRKRSSRKKGRKGLSVKVEPRVDSMINDSHDDDEENLEQNAARMLSSRFDPSCTAFSLKSISPNRNELSSLTTFGDDFVSRGISMSASSELSSGDLANGVSRPKNKNKRDGFSKTKRHFYEIFSRDVDALWVLNRRIKVYWPLDKSWYYGSVCDYSPETKLHHIKYDDRDEEWIDLQNERFKLLLLPSEVPQKAETERISRGTKNDDRDDNLPSDESLESSYLDSEPIISWLVRSNRRVKSSHLSSSKRHKTSYLSPELSQKLSRAVSRTEHKEKSHSLKMETNKLNRNMTLPDNVSDPSRVEKSRFGGKSISGYKISPIVYVRRRFKKKNNGLIKTDCKAFGSTSVASWENGIHTLGIAESERPLSVVDNVGLLKLTVPLVEFKKFRLEPGLPVYNVHFTLGADSWLIQALLLLKYGTIMNTWPKIHLEILFVDSDVGLRVLLFKGSLMQAVEFIFLVMTVFYRPDQKVNSIDIPVPVTTIRFKLSCSEDSRKQHIFVVYSFCQVKLSKWLFLNSKLQQHCLLVKQLPLSECNYDNLKTLEISSNLLPLSFRSRESPTNEGLMKENLHGVIPTTAPQSSDTETNVPSVRSHEDDPNYLIDKDHVLSVEFPSLQPDEKPVVATSTTAPQSSDMALSLSNNIVLSPKVTGPRLMWSSGRNSLISSHVRSGGKPDFGHNVFSSGPKKRRTQVQYTFPSGGLNSSSKHSAHNHGRLPFHRIRKANGKRASEVSGNLHGNKGLLACNGNVLITTGEKGWRECGAHVELESADCNEWKLAVKFSGTTKYSYKAYHFLQPGSTNRYTLAMMWRGGKDWALEFPDRNQWMLFKEMYEECFNRNLRAASVKSIPIPGVHLIEKFDASGTELPFIRSSLEYIRQVENDAEMAMDPSHVLYDMDSEDEMWVSGHQKSCADRGSEGEEVTEELFERTMDMFEKVAFAQQRVDFHIDEIEEFMVEIGPMESIKTIHGHWRRKRLQKGMPLIRHLQSPLWEIYQLQVREWEQAVAKTNTSLSSGCNDKNPPPEKPPMFAFCLKPRGLEMPNKGSKQRSHRRYPVSTNSSFSHLGDHDGHFSTGRRSNGHAYDGDEKVMYVGNNNYECSDTSPSYKPAARVFSPRAASNFGPLSLSNDSYEWNNHRNPKVYKNKSKNIGFLQSPDNVEMLSPNNYRTESKRNGINRGNTSLPSLPNQRNNQLDGLAFDEFQLRDASSAAQHALNMARLKREKATRLLYRADLATHKAAVALMTAEAIKAASEDLNDNDNDDSDDDESTDYDSFDDDSDDDDSDSESTSERERDDVWPGKLTEELMWRVFHLEIVAGVPLDIVRGANDPANFVLPQQPLQ